MVAIEIRTNWYNGKIIIIRRNNRLNVFSTISFILIKLIIGSDKIKVKDPLIPNIINNSIKNLSAKVKGCALCEASAGVVVNYFLNKNLPTNDFMEYFDRWLAKEYDKYPNELPEELKIFSPIQDIKNRHTCIKMPFEAFFKSIKN